MIVSRETTVAHGPGWIHTYDFLLGRWRVERSFFDRLRRERGTFIGTLDVVATGTGEEPTARYAEEGRFTLGSYQGRGRRSLGLVRGATGGVAIHFEDGRPFVDCDLAPGGCRATHRCGDDLYEISWQVVSGVAMTERWRVAGPRKDYDAWTLLRRVPGARQCPRR